MSILVYGNDELFAAWAAKQIDIAHGGFQNGRTLAIATGPEATDKLLAVCVYHDYDPRFLTCALSIAANPEQPVRWCTRTNIRAILRVPFEQYKCRKVWTIHDIKNKAAERLRQLVGFKIEGHLRDQFGPKRHAVMSGMLAKEYFASWGKPPAPRSQPDQTHVATSDVTGASA